MKSISRFGRWSGCWCQDLVTDPQFPVFKYINWSAKSIFWKQELRQTGTGWSSAKTAREGCHAGSERERENELGKEKKARLGTAQSNQLLLSAFSAWASGKKTILGYRKTQNFLVFKLRRLFKSLGLFESGGTLNDAQSPVLREIRLFFLMKPPQCLSIHMGNTVFDFCYVWLNCKGDRSNLEDYRGNI